ncbi:Serine/threonine-protein kinase Nek8, related [Eimeria mitis]|uniref:non-specific serine/threonine protein kinase n=1 Tax=Eimeria mitis TaxID=44415 RepID=U6K0I9_9EIME|nr:Serine/threonine-protein kinase Nek8, related [Eimeria mitis]CDJ31204.1 Serine/threonine-protein kinase Nek8, related [Eimeria mitis]
MKRLRHPYVVRCVESFVILNTFLVIVMEYCAGGDLTSFLDKRRGPPKQLGGPSGGPPCGGPSGAAPSSAAGREETAAAAGATAVAAAPAGRGEAASSSPAAAAAAAAAECGELLEEQQILEWLLQLLWGLEYVHSQRVLHRDLKPSNILLSPVLPSSTISSTISSSSSSRSSSSSSRSVSLKIGDFGISKVMTATLGVATTAVGTPQYMSPEMLESQPYTVKSDVWALGCILYELCTFRSAFAADSFISLVWTIAFAPIEPISTVYTPHLHRLLAAMLQKDPTRRPTPTHLLRDPFLQAFVHRHTQPPPLPIIHQQQHMHVLQQQQLQQQQQQQQQIRSPQQNMQQIHHRQQQGDSPYEQQPEDFFAAQQQQQQQQQQEQQQQECESKDRGFRYK